MNEVREATVDRYGHTSPEGESLSVEFEMYHRLPTEAPETGNSDSFEAIRNRLYHFVVSHCRALF